MNIQLTNVTPNKPGYYIFARNNENPTLCLIRYPSDFEDLWVFSERERCFPLRSLENEDVYWSHKLSIELVAKGNTRYL